MVRHGKVRATLLTVLLVLSTLCLGGAAQAAMPSGACHGPGCEPQIGCTGSANAQAAPLPAPPTVTLMPADELPVPASGWTIFTVGHAKAPPDRPFSPLAPRSPPLA
ncbi:MAG: hypothetical protein ACREM3_23220 [Candidatus Rokuibacteriota bacterium]